MERFKKALWFAAGILCLGIAYIGLITPGIPWSTPCVGAAYCFARSSKRWHDWLMGHRLFGPFLRNWSEKRVFPTAGKWAMVVTMDCSLVILWVTTGNIWLCLGVGLLMILGAVWAWRYPGSICEYQRRISSGLRVGWLR